MELKDLLELSGVILGSLGGAAAIIFGFSSWLGKVWADRLMTKDKAEYEKDLESIKNRLIQDTESHKIKLKKSEFLFQKEFEAASKMVEFRQSILPEHYMPEMDWGNVEEDIANNFDYIEKWLKSFLGSHGAILSNEAKDLIELSIYDAGSNKHYEKPDAPKSAREGQGVRSFLVPYWQVDSLHAYPDVEQNAIQIHPSHSPGCPQAPLYSSA